MLISNNPHLGEGELVPSDDRVILPYIIVKNLHNLRAIF